MESMGLVHEVFIIVPIVISIIASYGLYKYAEKPIQNFLYKKYNLRKDKEEKAADALAQP